MPPIVKVFVSCLVALIALGVTLFREAVGLGAPALLVWGLAVGMIVGLWMFPEPRTGRVKGS
jgi:hypothetical protein